jgi:hypothetical protein
MAWHLYDFCCLFVGWDAWPCAVGFEELGLLDTQMRSVDMA